jgi:hypothetical protein
MSGRTVGYVLVFAHFTPKKANMQVTETSLRTESGAVVEVLANTPENDKELDQSCFLIPKDPLKPKTTYVATVKAVVDGDDGPKPIEKTWRFTTGP